MTIVFYKFVCQGVRVPTKIPEMFHDDEMGSFFHSFPITPESYLGLLRLEPIYAIIRGDISPGQVHHRATPAVHLQMM